jgi:hypothetical protein
MYGLNLDCPIGGLNVSSMFYFFLPWEMGYVFKDWEIPPLMVWDNKTQSLLVFFALFATQVSIYSAYAIFVYPYFVSPLRHLPQVKGGLPLLGHGISMRKNGPGVMAKKW